MKRKLLASLLFVVSFLPCHAEFRTLVSSDGKSMKAELISHNGEKVKIRREDGKEFEIDPGIFCKQDHESILAWMKANPPKIDYRLRADANKKISNDSEDIASGYYELSLRNDGQDAVKGIKILYRVLYTRYGSEGMQGGKYVLDKKLEFNRTLVLNSEKIMYSRSKYYREDGLRGCLMRVLDPKGEIVMDWVSSEVNMKGVSWESTSPRKSGENPDPKIEIR